MCKCKETRNKNLALIDSGKRHDYSYLHYWLDETWD